MMPTPLLIAQRLDEVARELRAIAGLMDDHLTATVWHEVKNELTTTAKTAEWFSQRIRSEP